MRARCALAVLLLALAALLVAPASAQEIPEAVEMLTDPPGDAPTTVGGADTTQDRFPNADLVGLDVREGEESFDFTLRVAGFPEADPVQEEVNIDYTAYSVELSVAGQGYSVQAYQSGSYFDAVWCIKSASYYDCYEPLDATLDRAAGSMRFRVPRDEMNAGDGSPLIKGDEITGFRAMSEARTFGVIGGLEVSARDGMPDTGVGTVPWIVQSGGASVGHLVLTSETPVRVSNGEATTFLYRLDLANTLDRRDTVRFEAAGVPDGWVVTFPQEEVRMDPDTEQEVAVLVTVPFNHQHGLFKSFNVTALSRSDPLARSTAELGVRYTRVPQPAGHHDTLWLHDRDDFFFVNALEEEEVPDDEVTSSSSGGCSFSGSGVSGSSQLFPLMPQLEIGIDVAMERTGLAKLTVQSPTPMAGSHSVGGFVLVWPENDYPSTCAHEPPPEAILEIGRSAPLELEANAPETLELPIVPLPYGDRLEYEPGMAMGILLVTWQETGAPFTFSLTDDPVAFLEGSSFQLPLNEYHDPVDEYFSSLSGIELYSDAEQQRPVNPGETVVFRLTAENIGLQAASFDLELTGSNTAWARILGDTRIELGAGAKRELAVAVAAPEGATAGEMADVTLHAVKADDANVRSLIRLLATVDTAQDHPDESDQAGGLDESLRGEDAPGFQLAVLLAGLGLAFAVSGRRR